MTANGCAHWVMYSYMVFDMIDIHFHLPYVQLNNYVTNIESRRARLQRLGRVCRSLREFLGSLPGKHFAISQAFVPVPHSKPPSKWRRVDGNTQ